jgi:hypothetical protein
VVGVIDGDQLVAVVLAQGLGLGGQLVLGRDHQHGVVGVALDPAAVELAHRLGL